VLLSTKVDSYLIRRQFRQSPFYNSMLQISVQPSGFVSIDPLSRVELSWSAFTRVTRFTDGFLVYSGTQFWWWPDAALSAGSVAEVSDILRAEIAQFCVV
jgi:hypothetical protein